MDTLQMIGMGPNPGPRANVYRRFGSCDSRQTGPQSVSKNTAKSKMYATPVVCPPTSSVELSLSAKSIKDRDIISKSDPFAVLFVKSGAAWSKIGQTEAKKDDLNPTWTKLFVVEFRFEALQQFKVEVYDQDSSAPNRLQDQDFIGAAEFTLGQIMGSPGQSGSFLLTRGKHKAKHQGSLLVKAEEVKASNEAARLRFSASGLANMDGLFSKSDPFLVISRLREDGNSWTQVHRSETIDNNLNPSWKRFEISLQQLCNGDYRRAISLQVFDEDRGGKAELIGQVNTSLEELLAKRGTNFILHNEALQKKKGKKYTNAGLLVLAEGEIYREHSFIDYLRGGLEMNLVIGIDYTASNGPPNDPRRLIQQSMRIATLMGDPRKQKYFVLLIITDGAIMDMQATIDALVEASHNSPLSVNNL
ncbi:hypothetical protein BBJ29_007139 [Phytophthora kernoviae]|uniref:C2 domain-containing protein n=1 Tax=Phytophthora kernoviae TaxID=325452 RepID=A0A3F2S277_9STRA|nr:hypothetical protein BBJ29_007139 [Phytophthora kernoviae]RLN68036.1 hypothetical protein BBP00_00001255 [Phytophthora kernoviae]